MALKPLLAQDELLHFVNTIRLAKSIVLCAHRNPDGDAVGSALALQYYLRGLDKKANIILPNRFPDFLRWLPGVPTIIYYNERRKTADELIAQADAILCLDFNELSRLGEMAEAVSAAQAPRLLIDHHEQPDKEQFSFILSRPEMCATCELVFRLLEQLGAYRTLSRAQATCLYAGMMTDTGAFTYNSSTPDLYFIISLLLRRRIDKDEIYRRVYHTWSLDRLKLWNFVLGEKLCVNQPHRAAIYTLTREEMKEHRFIRGDAEGLVNEPLKVSGMKLSIALREDTETDVIRVSLRSSNGFHCREMAERFFNGGGHDDAAGGSLPFPLEDALQTTRQAIEAYAEELSAPSPFEIQQAELRAKRKTTGNGQAPTADAGDAPAASPPSDGESSEEQA